MPPRPVPTQLKILRGNPGKQALNRAEPQPSVPPQVPQPPKFLNAHARAEWDRVAVKLLRLRLLTVVDLQPLAAYCAAYGRWRTTEEALARMAADDPALLPPEVRAPSVRRASTRVPPIPRLRLSRK